MLSDKKSAVILAPLYVATLKNVPLSLNHCLREVLFIMFGIDLIFESVDL